MQAHQHDGNYSYSSLTSKDKVGNCEVNTALCCHRPTHIAYFFTFSPSPSVTIDIIQVDNSGQSLTAGETLRNLEEVAEEILKSDTLAGAQVAEILALNPSKCITL